MHYADLTLCRYHSGPLDDRNWRVPLLAIGWLEHPHPFPTGIPPNGFLGKLKEFVSCAHSDYFHLNFRGVHFCSQCPRQYSLPQPGPIWSQEVIFVPGTQVVYTAPGGIVHYVGAHAYLPPPEFVEAVMRCPTYGSPEFEEAVRLANAGHPPPLITAAEDHKIWQHRFEETIRQRKALESNQP